MRCVIQRVKEAQLHIDNHLHSSIQYGMVILIAVHKDDIPQDIAWMTKKIASLRIFNDTQGKMNLSLPQVSGELLVVSQFTLYADVSGGNRPSFIESAPPQEAKKMYEDFLLALKNQLPTTNIQTGIFAADMKVGLVNDGPVTIIIDSKHQ